MSYTVVRGQPTAAQRYLDTLLDEILLEQGIKPNATDRSTVTVTQILYHALKKNPENEFMTNGATGEVITNGQLLKRAISLARAINSKDMKGKTVMNLMRNHKTSATVYFGVMFSGTLQYMMDPKTTAYELVHFLKLIEPSIIFYDSEHHDILMEALKSTDLTPTLVLADISGPFEKFLEGNSGDLEGFTVPPASMDDGVFLVPTSGSTGMPKACITTHRGLVTQLPTFWTYHDQFPTPTRRAMILTTMQWISFTMATTTCVANAIPILISPKITTPENVAEMIEKYKPTWMLAPPTFAMGLVRTITAEQAASLETLLLLGAAPSKELLAALREKLSKTCHVHDGYGLTETHGFIVFSDTNLPPECNGKVLNTYQYKIVNDNGDEVGPNGTGELYVKGVSIQGYFRTDVYAESFTPDGWFMTGDAFHVDQQGSLSFLTRKKFNFKYLGCHVAPEEVERVIGSVPGVKEAVVCASERGPAAAVVVAPGCDVTREQIHAVVNSCLSDHKRLHGGIAFVSSIPHTNSGKLKRDQCSKFIDELVKTGQCFVEKY